MNSMKTIKYFNKSWIFGLAVLAITSCEKDDTNTTTTEPVVEGDYLVAAVFNSATYFLTADDLEANDTITPVGNNGLEYSNTFTHYVVNGTQGLLALKYGQGGTHVGAGFSIGANGRAVQVGTDFEVPSGFSTAGSVGNYVITARSGQTLTDGSTGVVVNFIDMANNNSLQSKSKATGDFPEMSGRQVSLIGIAAAGNNQFFTGLDVTGGSPDSVYVAKMDQSLNVIQMYTDDRLSRSGGQWRSARYAQIGTADNGDTYVFSGSYAAATTKPAGALLIKNGAADFDASYYFNIEEKASGYRFKRVWHVKEDYFLIEFYNTPGAPASTAVSTKYGIVKMSTKDFKWVTGIPNENNITGIGWPFVYNSKVYIGITTATDAATVYHIDPATAVGKKGLVVTDVESVEGLAFITQ